METERTLTAAVLEDGDWYVARCLEVEVASQGATIDEALENLREALELYFEDDEVPVVPPPARDSDRDPPVSVSPALPRVSGEDVVRALGRAGFEHRSTKGSHAKLLRW